MKTKQKQKKKLLGIYLPLPLIRKIKLYAAKKMISQSAVVEEAVKKLFEEG